MTTQEFELIALKLFDKKKKTKEDFNPIIDAAKELEVKKLGRVDLPLFIYGLMYIRKHHGNLAFRTKIKNPAKRILVGFDAAEAKQQATREVAQKFAENPNQDRKFDLMVKDRIIEIRKEHTTVEKLEQLKTYSINHSENHYFEYTDTALKSLEIFANALRSTFNHYVLGILDQHL